MVKLIIQIITLLGSLIPIITKLINKSKAKKSEIDDKPKTVSIMTNKPELPEIEKIAFSENHYYPDKYPKDQIVIHHSAGWDNARGMFDWWGSDPQKVATCMGIEDGGKIYQGFSPAHWAHHLGVTNSTFLAFGIEPIMVKLRDGRKRMVNNDLLNQKSIAIEICNWGRLVKRGDKFYSWANVEVPESKVVKYLEPFRGSKYYEKYTDAEIEALKKILLHWHHEYQIPLQYNDSMWDISKEALDGSPGIWTHVSYRPDKSDAHPQPELIRMLQSLTGI